MESAAGSSRTPKSDAGSLVGVGVNAGAVVGVGTDVTVADEQASSNAKSATKHPVTNRSFNADLKFVGITEI